MAITVLIADDQTLVRVGFRMIIEARDGFTVVGEAADGLDAVTLARQFRPDVVLMDIRMPVMDGVEATRILATPGAAPAPRVIILTTFDLDQHVYDALRAGASGFLLKDTPPDDLITAIQVVAAGEAMLGPSVTRRLPAPRRADPGALKGLTAREADVLRLLARGRSNAQIAAALSIGETTVKSHVAHVLLKLDMHDRVQAVVYAYESGLVTPGEG